MTLTPSRLEAIGDADSASQDVMIVALRELEKRQWGRRVQLGERA